MQPYLAVCACILAKVLSCGQSSSLMPSSICFSCPVAAGGGKACCCSCLLWQQCAEPVEPSAAGPCAGGSQGSRAIHEGRPAAALSKHPSAAACGVCHEGAELAASAALLKQRVLPECACLTWHLQALGMQQACCCGIGNNVSACICSEYSHDAEVLHHDTGNVQAPRNNARTSLVSLVLAACIESLSDGVLLAASVTGFNDAACCQHGMHRTQCRKQRAGYQLSYML